MSALSRHLKTLRQLENGTDRTAKDPIRQFCQFGPLGSQGNTALACAVSRAVALGWQVHSNAAGILVDTTGGSPDPALLDELAESLDQPERWPDQVVLDQAEVVICGDLDATEQESGNE